MPDEEYRFHPAARAKIDDVGQSLLTKLERITLSKQSGRFPNDIPVSSKISDKDIIGSPVVGQSDVFGNWKWRAFARDGATYGLSPSNYLALRRIVDESMKVTWARTLLGSKFLEDTIFLWCQTQFCSPSIVPLSDFITNTAIEKVRSYRVLIPIAYLVTESDFDFGCVQVKRITPAFLDKEEATRLENNPSGKDDFSALFAELRKRMQGLSAIVATIRATPEYANERGIEIAESAIGLLRMFSGAAYIPWAVCPCAILGSEFVPQTMTLFTHGDNEFHFQKRVAVGGIGYWTISNDDLTAMRTCGFAQLGAMIEADGLSKFQIRLRSAVLAYSKGLLLPDINERLVHTLSGLETLLLKNSSEPIQQNLGERMAFLVTRDAERRRAIAANVREVYSMRSRYIHHRVTTVQEEQLEMFIDNARDAFGAAIMNSSTFQTPEEFIEAIERIKFGG